MNNSKYLIISVLSLLLFFYACNSDKAKLTIAISKANNLENSTYVKWLSTVDSDIEFINLYGLKVDSALKIIDNCDALLLTGGEDVYPEWYGQISDTSRCENIDRYRDSLEIYLIRKAVKINMPLLGICRGEQILNVALGGSLIVDIPTEIDTNVIHRNNSWDCYHEIKITKNSLLENICKAKNMKVNSYHHQAVKVLADDLQMSSFTKNNVIESIEWKNKTDKAFLLAVQWHPERLYSENEDLSLPIAQEFIKNAINYHHQK